MDTDELDEDRSHNDVNEITGHDIDDSGSDDYTLTYDAVGNLTDDGEDYEYVWDAFGRLRKILDRSDSSVVEELRYNGLGFMIAEHCRDKDANTDWGAASDGVLKQRIFYCQNWRGDVVALVGSQGYQIEQVRSSAYGVPFGLPGRDCDFSAGVTDAQLDEAYEVAEALANQ